MRTFSALIFLLFVSSTFAQTIRRVNADPTVTGTNVYQTLQAAHDAAVAGDILIVEPGEVGGLDCVKTLTIYGNGTPTITDRVYIRANNVKISGIIFQSYYVASWGVTKTSLFINDVTGTIISRCSIASIKISSATTASVSNTVISQNTIGRLMFETTPGSTVTVNNNIISNLTNYEALGGYDAGPFTNGASITFNHNVIQSSFNIGYSTFLNNIFTSVTTVPISTNSSAYFYNVFPNGSAIDVGSNNKFLTSLSSLYDTNFKPKDNTELKTAGQPDPLTGIGTEVGAYGGATPYVGFVPAIPTVTKLRSDGVGNSTTPIKLTISAKSNN